ncbi:MAG: hypothetical protein Q7V17_00965 [Afipia sp.]|nr:hypothetical protein [Afipia sp.]
MSWRTSIPLVSSSLDRLRMSAVLAVGHWRGAGMALVESAA